jgi:hypothetical protein
MKTLLVPIAAAVLLGFATLGSATAAGQGYVVPTVVESFYPPVPVYAYPAPVVVVPRRVVYYWPVISNPVVVPSPVWVGRPVVVGPAGRVYVVGRPVRNAVRAVLP